jgi:hypothetical protein
MPIPDDELGLLIRRHAVRHTPPAGLAARIAEALRSEAGAAAAPAVPVRNRRDWWQGLAWFGTGAATAWGLALVLLATPVPPQDALGEAVTANHVRSLMASHLADVASSDQHTRRCPARDRQQHADPAGRRPAQAGADRHAAQPGAQRIGHVEGRVVQRGGQRLRLAGHVHQADLQGRADGDDGADQEGADRRRDHVLRREGEAAEHQHRPHAAAADGAHQRAVGQARAHQVAATMPKPEQRQHERHARERQAGHLGQRRLDVAEDREHAAEADGADAQREPDVLVAQRLQFAHGARAGCGGHVGNARRSSTTASSAIAPTNTKAARQPKCWPSAEAIGHAGQRGAGQPQHHHAHRARAPPGRRQRCRHQRRHAEVGAVRQAGGKRSTFSER